VAVSEAIIIGVVTASALPIAVIADLVMLPAIFSLLERRQWRV